MVVSSGHLLSFVCVCLHENVNNPVNAPAFLTSKCILLRWERSSIPVNKVKLSTLLAMLAYANEGLDELL